MSTPPEYPPLAAARGRWARRLLGSGVAVSLAVEGLRFAGTSVPGWRWLQSLLFAYGFLYSLTGSAPGKERLPGLLPFGAAAALLGSLAAIGSPDGAQVVAVGSLAALVWGGLRVREAGRIDPTAAAALVIAMLGVVLDLGAGLAWSGIAPGLKWWLGPDDGLRLRCLRFARAAAGTLPVLLLAWRLHPLPPPDRTERLLLAGVLGVPAVLLLAAGLHPVFAYLLWIPGLALTLGTGTAARRALRSRRGPEAVGWALIAASMAAGLLMTAFAFGGPLPPPPGMARYHGTMRSVARVGHAYAVVTGLLVLVWLHCPQRRHEDAKGG